VATASPTRMARPSGQLRRRRRRATLAWQIAFGVLLLAVWQTVSGRWIDPFWLSKPSLIAGSILGQYRAGTLIPDIVTTLQNTLIGYVLGAGLGVVCGFVLATLEGLAEVLNPYIIAAYGIPRIALAPLVIVWFGIGAPSKIFLAAMMAFFLTFFNTFTGVREVEPRLIDVARVMGAGRWTRVYKVILPAASPWVIAGLRISIPNALVSEVVGEFIAAQHGLGYRIVYYANTFDTTGTMAGVLLLMIIVFLTNKLLDRAERRILRWQPQEARRPG
jgi:NitT/TauT family transport system permease protein